MESHKTENVVLLSDILEVEVPQKYFLSKEQTERIIFTESDTETDTEETHKSSIGGGITEALDTGQGGGRGHHTIEVIGHDPKRKVHDSDRVMDIGGGITNTQSQRLQGTGESRCIVVGNTNPSGKGMNGNCYFSEGLNPSVTCNKNEGNRIAIPVIDAGRINLVEMSGYNATLKAGGGVTQTALALNARDYKGLSGSNQMMTAAILCLPSTKDSEPKKEQLPIASRQEKTEDSQEENRKGL